MDDLYTSEAWKNATPKQRQDFISKIRADARIIKEKIAEEAKRKKRMEKIHPVPVKKSRNQKRKERLLDRQIRRADQSKRAKPITIAGIDVTTTDFLSTYEWRKLRMQALKKYGPKCMCCGATPKDGAVMNVDHIKPRKTFPSLALDINNLQILCHDCNHGKGNWDQTDWR